MAAHSSLACGARYVPYSRFLYFGPQINFCGCAFKIKMFYFFKKTMPSDSSVQGDFKNYLKIWLIPIIEKLLLSNSEMPKSKIAYGRSIKSRLHSTSENVYHSELGKII